MKLFYYFLLFLFFHYTSFSQLSSFYVYPYSTDTNYTAAQDSHYVAINNSVVSNGKLFVFIGGTGSLTKNYKHLPQLAANLGYHAVSIAYPNSPSISASCGGSTNSSCYEDFRQEVCYGTPLNSSVAVDTFNCIYTRLVKLLNYLTVTYPADNWGQFIGANQLLWPNISVGGHSQGSGHALYFGYTQNCGRVLMFSGANDFSGFFNAPAPWITNPGLTSANKFYSFLHLQDDVFPYAKQYAVVQASGMTAGGDDSTSVDSNSSPYNYSHCLYTNLSPLFPGVYSSWHDATAVDFYTPVNGGGQPVYDPVWIYMLSDQNTFGVKEPGDEKNLMVFPNPVDGTVNLFFTAGEKNKTLTIINSSGEVIYSEKNTEQEKMELSLHEFPKGIYLIRIGNKSAKIIKE